MQEALGLKSQTDTAPCVATFNIEGVTLCLLFHLQYLFMPISETWKVNSSRHCRLLLKIIIDEMSMVGKRMLGQIEHRLCHAFLHKAQEVLGGCTFLRMFGGFWPSLSSMDLPYIHSSMICHLRRDQNVCQMFVKAVTISQIMQQNGQEHEQVCFRELRTHLRNGKVSTSE